MSAASIVAETMAKHAGGISPLRSVDSARKVGSGSKEKIFAVVTLFDGQPGRLELERWAYGWSHMWLDLPGGAIELIDGKWRRAA